MARIESLLDEWVGKGLITGEQRLAIATYELAKPQRSWVLFGVSAIGIIALVTGVISIIAANWDSIPESVQLGGYFVIQLLVGVALFTQRNRDGALRESLIVLFSLFFFAGIGLIGQMFHLESDGQSALRFWLVLTLPITLFSRNRLMPNLWCAGFSGAVILWMVDPQRVSDWGDTNRDIGFYLRLMTGYSIAFLTLALGLLRRGWMNPYVASTARFWGLLATVGIGGSLGGSYAATVLRTVELPVPITPWLAAGISLFSLWWFGRPDDHPGWKRAMTLLILGSAFSITVRFPFDESLLRRVCELAVFLFVWGSAAAAAAFALRRRLFNFCTFLIAVRLVIAYFEVFGSLAATGLGLIFSGCVILGTVWLWAKSRARLLRFFRVAE